MQRSDLGRRWNDFWYRPEAPENLAAARILLSATALWIVLSRDLPGVAALPEEIWRFVAPETRLRYLLVFAPGLERLLYAALAAALAAALVGFRARAACLASALLLYHFAPLESVVWTPNPYLRGLTIPLLGLLVLSASRCDDAWAIGAPADRPEPSGEYRWPLVLMQVFFCEIYFFSAYAKLFTSGLAWLEPANLQCYLTFLQQTQPAPLAGSGLALALAAHPLACGFMAVAGLAIDFLFPLVLFNRRLRLPLVAFAAVFHVANSILFHIFFQNAVLLLLFVDWRARRVGLEPSPRADGFDLARSGAV